MTCYEKISLFLNSINIAVLGFLTYKIAKSNESLTNIQVDQNNKNQPNLCIWMVGQDNDGLVEFVIVNSGGKDLLLKSLRVEVNNQDPSLFFVNCDSLRTPVGDQKLENLVFEKGKIYKLFFKYSNQRGSYQFRLTFYSFKGEQDIVSIDQSQLGPYNLNRKELFHY